MWRWHRNTLYNAYINKVVYYWRFKEPIQFDFVIFNDVLQQHTNLLLKHHGN